MCCGISDLSARARERERERGGAYGDVGGGYVVYSICNLLSDVALALYGQ